MGSTGRAEKEPEPAVVAVAGAALFIISYSLPVAVDRRQGENRTGSSDRWYTTKVVTLMSVKLWGDAHEELME